MSALTDKREAMAAILTDALPSAQASSAMPSRIVPPAAIVLAGTPYLEASGTFGTFTMGLDVVLVADAKVSATGMTTLDGLTDDAVVALVNAGIAVSEVSEPWQLTSANASYLAVTITTNQPVSL